METVISIKNLVKKYEGFLLKDISLDIPSGSIVGLVGENGAGKTTTLKAMIGAIKPDGGEINIFGKNLNNNEKTIKQDIAVVMEESFFYQDYTPLEVQKVLKAIYKNWDEALYISYLQKYKLPKNKSIKEFSKGMKMKLSIASALAHHPKLLILDEPTSGLDPVIRSEILDEFLEFIQEEDHTILFSSHITTDLEKVADYIVFMHDGKIVFHESKDELLYSYGILKCGLAEFQTIAKEDYISYRKNAFGYELLVKNKKEIAKKYSGFILDPATLDDIMLFYIRGDK